MVLCALHHVPRPAEGRADRAARIHPGVAPAWSKCRAFLFPQASWGFSRYHLLSIVIGAMFVLANLAFYKLSQTEQVSTLAPLTALYVIVPVVLGMFFLGEPPTARKVIGIILGLASLYLLSGMETEP
ncbi:MAG: DMT family transporter [Gemmatimonadaceae bacterium]|nr:DMT family transporter [Gemmatimonadaceae bacterium]